MKYYPHAIKVLQDIIKKNFPDADPKEGFDNLTSHLLWMLDGIEKMTNASGKAGRWLGYVLGRMEALGLLTNQESRDIIREDVLSGYE